MSRRCVANPPFTNLCDTSRIIGFKLLWTWFSHQLVLNDTCSKDRSGYHHKSNLSFKQFTRHGFFIKGSWTEKPTGDFAKNFWVRLNHAKAIETQNGGFLKWWYPKTMGFPTKMIILGCFGGTPIFGNIHIFWAPFHTLKTWCDFCCSKKNPQKAIGRLRLEDQRPVWPWVIGWTWLRWLWHQFQINDLPVAYTVDWKNLDVILWWSGMILEDFEVILEWFW